MSKLLKSKLVSFKQYRKIPYIVVTLLVLKLLNAMLVAATIADVVFTDDVLSPNSQLLLAGA